jgi:GT2 family glycosyltransferase
MSVRMTSRSKERSRSEDADAVRRGLALFSCADRAGNSQLNAWRSWIRIPSCTVSIFGDAPDVVRQVTQLGVTSIAPVTRNERGRPRLDWIFQMMHERAPAQVLGYVNSDIIILPGLADSIAAVGKDLDEFLIIARRWNVSFPHTIDFGPRWADEVRDFVRTHGKLYTPYAIDLFVFSRGVCLDLPPFALGNDGWDNYLVMRARRRGIPVVDVTSTVMLVHQDHALGPFGSQEERRRSPESRRNFVWMGDSYALLGRTSDATHVVADGCVQSSATATVTVVIPHRGNARTLCHCLRAVEHQSYARSYIDIIVVNNDPDAPLRYLEADFPSLRIVNQDAPGPAAARNTGIACATGEIVALFDSDTVPDVRCVEHAARFLLERPECDIAVCRIAPSHVRGRLDYVQRSIEWFDAVTHYNQQQWLTHAGAFVTAGFVVRKNVFDAYGYFDELFPEAASEDWEWTTRALSAGAKAEFCPTAIVNHPTVRTIADLRRKKRRYARGACIFRTVQEHGVYRVRAILQDEWDELLARARAACQDPRVPARYRVGVLVAAVCSAWWMLHEKLCYRRRAARLVRRQRLALQKPLAPNARRTVPRPAAVARSRETP